MPPKKSKKSKQIKPQPQPRPQSFPLAIRIAGPAMTSESAPVGPPRLDKYNRLLSRMYEAIIVLQELGEVRGAHTPKLDKSPSRQFRDDLAFLCEYNKGGKSCTAVGVEDRPDCLVYWVAANECPERKIVPFLTSLLGKLKSMMRLSDDQKDNAAKQLTAECIEYAEAKLKNHRSILRKEILKCISHLADHGSASDLELANWLKQFTQASDNVTMCVLAYESRKSDSMKQLQRICHDTSYHGHNEIPNDAKTSPFAGARHHLGRLADHIRSPKRLVANLDVVKLLENPFHVQAIERPPCVPPPQPDNLTTLKGICKRLFKAEDPMTKKVTDELEGWDRKHGIFENILARYGDVKPRVHAEVQVLEHFHSSGKAWAENDPYIGCTKPACFCCKLYFRHHPARPVERESHLKVWLNWSPPQLAGGQDPAYSHQRDIINSMIADIREDAIAQILSKGRNHSRWHADSRTGITSTVANEPGTVSELEVSTRATTPSSEVDRTSSDSEAGSFVSYMAPDSPRAESPAAYSPTADSVFLGSRAESYFADDAVTLDGDSESDGGAPLW